MSDANDSLADLSARAKAAQAALATLRDMGDEIASAIERYETAYSAASDALVAIGAGPLPPLAEIFRQNLTVNVTGSTIDPAEIAAKLDAMSLRGITPRPA